VSIRPRHVGTFRHRTVLLWVGQLFCVGFWPVDDCFSTQNGLRRVGRLFCVGFCSGGGWFPTQNLRKGQRALGSRMPPGLWRFLATRSLRGTEAQGATFVELFFDLVFVFAVTQVVAVLAHDLTWGGVVRAGIIFGWSGGRGPSTPGR
jgi:hypothetical protein